MRQYKSIIAILVAIVLVSSLIACTQKPHTENVTQAVTDENGEVVTDENGELVTEEIEAQVVTDANGNPVTEVVTDGEGKPVTTVKDGEYVNVTQNVTRSAAATTRRSNNTTTKKNGTTTTKKADSKTTTKKATKKPAAPSKVSKITASDIKENSVIISWTKVKCDGYQVQYSEDGVNYTDLSKNTTSTSMKVDGLKSYTKYSFRVRAFNKNSAGTSTSKWTSTTATTKAANDSRYITFEITLPMDSNRNDTLIIKVGDDQYEESVKLNGSTFTFKTTKKYKGLVQYEITLKSTGTGASGKTDKDFCEVDVSATGIYVLEGDDD